MDRKIIIFSALCAVYIASVAALAGDGRPRDLLRAGRGAALDKDLETGPLVNLLTANLKEDVPITRRKRAPPPPECCSCDPFKKRSDGESGSDNDSDSDQNCCSCVPQ